MVNWRRGRYGDDRPDWHDDAERAGEAGPWERQEADDAPSRRASGGSPGPGAQLGAYAQRGYDDGWDQRESERFGGQGIRGMPLTGGYGIGDGAYAGNYQPSGADGNVRHGGRGGQDYDVNFGRYPEPRWGDRHRQPNASTAARTSPRPGGRAGGHRGRGPSNYTRSDERIREDINERLMDDDAVDATHVQVDVADGVVTLGGTVDARWAKHHVEDIADDCGGVKDVENRIRVRRSGHGDRDAASGGAFADE